ncbi:MAG: peptide deformylase, partial [Bacteroidales bacterium]|nr:peptide deformylase [Bacteroidales bacterium]
IKVEYYDETLEKKVEEFDNFAARMIEHEFSHLDGVLFTDLVAPIRKKLVMKKLQRISTGKVPTRYNSRIK